MNPFDYVNAINTSKQNLMRGTDNDKLAEKSYNTFLTNRAMSYHMDTIGVANEMNQRHEADNLLQFEYFLNTVRPKKRFAKWVKKDDEGDLSVVKQYYGYNDAKALQALSILSPEQLITIRNTLEKGGSNDN
jgi:hypothetical protein